MYKQDIGKRPLWSIGTTLWSSANHKIQVWLNVSWWAFEFGRTDEYEFIGYHRRFFRFGRIVICYTGSPLLKTKGGTPERNE